MLYPLLWQMTAKTLTDKYVDKVMEKLMSSFTDKAGAEIR